VTPAPVHTWHGMCRGGWRQQVPMGAGACSDWEKAGVGAAREAAPAFMILRVLGKVHDLADQALRRFLAEKSRQDEQQLGG
jgi:hypothetical protein